MWKPWEHIYLMAPTEDVQQGQYGLVQTTFLKELPQLEYFKQRPGRSCFGRLPSTQWQPRLQGIETTDPDAEQPPVNPDGSKTEWCGQACLAFGLVCKAYGYNIARAV